MAAYLFESIPARIRNCFYTGVIGNVSDAGQLARNENVEFPQLEKPLRASITGRICRRKCCKNLKRFESNLLCRVDLRQMAESNIT